MIWEHIGHVAWHEIWVLGPERILSVLPPRCTSVHWVPQARAGSGTVVASQCTVAPAALVSLFALSLINDILCGNFTYVVLLTVVCFGLGVASAHGTTEIADRQLTNAL
jgi:hypothetical protein